MPAFCGVVKCGNRSDRDKKSFFRLPSALSKGDDLKKRLSEERREKWLLAIRRADLNDTKKKWLRVCEDHFITGKPAELYDVKNPDWVPSQKMGYHKNTSKTSIHQHEWLEKRMAQSEKTNSKQQSVNNTCDKDIEREHFVNVQSYVACEMKVIEKQSVECQTDLTKQDLRNMEKAYRDTVAELTEVRDKVSKLCISENTFKNDDEKTRYYTGLQNFATLMVIFNILQNELPHTSTSSLSKFQQFILTLMRLRLNLDFTDLSYRFCVSKSTVSRTFSTCIYIMYKRLEHFLVWPDRDELIKEVPQSFVESFGNKVAIIINSFEVFIERPSNLPPSAQTASTHKDQNKIKFLIGICPLGSIAFISSAWEGSTEDQHIVENCGILEHLLPDDIIICDRGFNIHNEVELYCEVIKIPEKAPKGRKILTGLEIAERNNFHGINFSKHVERVVSKLKQYRILYRTMPLSTLSSSNNEGPALIDQIVKVCCSLINISSLVIPID